MTDIVERLRDWTLEENSEAAKALQQDIHGAADEIERLRTENSLLRERVGRLVQMHDAIALYPLHEVIEQQRQRPAQSP